MLADKFGAYLSRLWLKRPADRCSECALAASCASKQECLHLLASSGCITRVDGDHRRLPLGAFEIGLVADGRGRTICNDVLHDERVYDREWAAAHNVQAFAGLPLVRDGDVIGVLALFSQSQLPSHFLETLDLFCLTKPLFIILRRITFLTFEPSNLLPFRAEFP